MRQLKETEETQSKGEDLSLGRKHLFYTRGGFI